ncbi:hypothetical protein ABL78_5072 [Leptomonas seymouri]|uniref:Uncharacterized protein n=1 Tax=Leptomonas seymouri TaxID=5684 RepID=A0A0N1HVN5_LEPSE|nr:hypothetical protein ABL78_5072 [Leptomonas seymouri]|eukprot:KPI85852.1 hypothetical protein ABL78_5072 [Leptomonas seymouri]
MSALLSEMVREVRDKSPAGPARCSSLLSVQAHGNCSKPPSVSPLSIAPTYHLKPFDAGDAAIRETSEKTNDGLKANLNGPSDIYLHPSDFSNTVTPAAGGSFTERHQDSTLLTRAPVTSRGTSSSSFCSPLLLAPLAEKLREDRGDGLPSSPQPLIPSSSTTAAATDAYSVPPRLRFSLVASPRPLTPIPMTAAAHIHAGQGGTTKHSLLASSLTAALATDATAGVQSRARSAHAVDHALLTDCVSVFSEQPRSTPTEYLHSGHQLLHVPLAPLFEVVAGDEHKTVDEMSSSSSMRSLLPISSPEDSQSGITSLTSAASAPASFCRYRVPCHLPSSKTRSCERSPLAQLPSDELMLSIRQQAAVGDSHCRQEGRPPVAGVSLPTGVGSGLLGCHGLTYSSSDRGKALSPLSAATRELPFTLVPPVYIAAVDSPLQRCPQPASTSSLTTSATPPTLTAAALNLLEGEARLSEGKDDDTITPHAAPSAPAPPGAACAVPMGGAGTRVHSLPPLPSETSGTSCTSRAKKVGGNHDGATAASTDVDTSAGANAGHGSAVPHRFLSEPLTTAPGQNNTNTEAGKVALERSPHGIAADSGKTDRGLRQGTASMNHVTTTMPNNGKISGSNGDADGNQEDREGTAVTNAGTRLTRRPADCDTPTSSDDDTVKDLTGSEELGMDSLFHKIMEARQRGQHQSEDPAWMRHLLANEFPSTTTIAARALPVQVLSATLPRAPTVNLFSAAARSTSSSVASLSPRCLTPLSQQRCSTNRALFSASPEVLAHATATPSDAPLVQLTSQTSCGAFLTAPESIQKDAEGRGDGGEGGRTVHAASLLTVQDCALSSLALGPGLSARAFYGDSPLGLDNEAGERGGGGEEDKGDSMAERQECLAGLSASVKHFSVNPALSTHPVVGTLEIGRAGLMVTNASISLPLVTATAATAPPSIDTFQVRVIDVRTLATVRAIPAAAESLPFASAGPLQPSLGASSWSSPCASLSTAETTAAAPANAAAATPPFTPPYPESVVPLSVDVRSACPSTTTWPSFSSSLPSPSSYNSNPLEGCLEGPAYNASRRCSSDSSRCTLPATVSCTMARGACRELGSSIDGISECFNSVSSISGGVPSNLSSTVINSTPTMNGDPLSDDGVDKICVDCTVSIPYMNLSAELARMQCSQSADEAGMQGSDAAVTTSRSTHMVVESSAKSDLMGSVTCSTSCGAVENYRGAADTPLDNGPLARLPSVPLIRKEPTPPLESGQEDSLRIHDSSCRASSAFDTGGAHPAILDSAIMLKETAELACDAKRSDVGRTSAPVAVVQALTASSLCAAPGYGPHEKDDRRGAPVKGTSPLTSDGALGQESGTYGQLVLDPSLYAAPAATLPNVGVSTANSGCHIIPPAELARFSGPPAGTGRGPTYARFSNKPLSPVACANATAEPPPPPASKRCGTPPTHDLQSPPCRAGNLVATPRDQHPV